MYIGLLWSLFLSVCAVAFYITTPIPLLLCRNSESLSGGVGGGFLFAVATAVFLFTGGIGTGAFVGGLLLTSDRTSSSVIAFGFNWLSGGSFQHFRWDCVFGSDRFVLETHWSRQFVPVWFLSVHNTVFQVIDTPVVDGWTIYRWERVVSRTWNEMRTCESMKWVGDRLTEAWTRYFAP